MSSGLNQCWQPNSAVESDAFVPALRASARAPHRER